ncbi:hypothetical protein [Biformimicrobium ophioploci]|uniref:Uncharacterized protein n=1 Tax=Biformimicrobium ophioploci TaxID=3036711 RepID=A0ABQ6LXG1_9GAMM|nr:hypothetical protein [Microbulbifer sp. NKW57]GMG86735.1 hypothetical protein MNKW57_10560 [Microbulbifer sp. NKW57]
MDKRPQETQAEADSSSDEFLRDLTEIRSLLDDEDSILDIPILDQVAAPAPSSTDEEALAQRAAEFPDLLASIQEQIDASDEIELIPELTPVDQTTANPVGTHDEQPGLFDEPEVSPAARIATSENPFLPAHIRARLTGGQVPRPSVSEPVPSTPEPVEKAADSEDALPENDPLQMNSPAPGIEAQVETEAETKIERQAEAKVEAEAPLIESMDLVDALTPGTAPEEADADSSEAWSIEEDLTDEADIAAEAQALDAEMATIEQAYTEEMAGTEQVDSGENMPEISVLDSTAAEIPVIETPAEPPQPEAEPADTGKAVEFATAPEAPVAEEANDTPAARIDRQALVDQLVARELPKLERELRARIEKMLDDLEA